MPTEINIPVQSPQLVNAGAKPQPSQLLQGQLAVNLVDRKIFTKDANGVIQQLGIALSDLAIVAETGSYNDLKDKPDIAATYTLPPAQPATLGGVMIPAGNGLSVDGDGNLKAAIISVAGKTGVVVLTPSDVSLPDDLMSGTGGTIAPKYMPASLVGAVTYQGTWNAATNDPPIASDSASAANKGFYYVVSVAGNTNVDGTSTWNVGDWILSNGTRWDRVTAQTSAVLSVNGQTGDVQINAANLPGLSAVGKSGAYSDLTGIPSTFPPSAHTQPASSITGLATVATTGNYNDLINRPPDASIAQLSFNAEGEPNLIKDLRYPFTRKCQFPKDFANSVAFAQLISGATQATIYLRQNGTQVGTLTIDTVNGNKFTSTGAATTFSPGDLLTFQFITTNIQWLAVNLQGTWQS